MTTIHETYAEALRLYTTTRQTQKAIAETCGVSVMGLRSYLYRHHRDLLMNRYNQEHRSSNDKLGGKMGQGVVAHQKYKEAIEACDSEEYLKYNISQIARLFGLNGTALANQLRMHYPEIHQRREQERIKRGMNDNQQRGPRPQSIRQYAEAVELYRSTELTVEEIAEQCGVSFTGLRQHLQFYHKDLRKIRMERREKNARQKQMGKRNGNNALHMPKEGQVEKYAKAVELYRTTDWAVEDIAEKEGLSLSGFRFHLRTWHSDLMMERRGVNACGEENPYERLKEVKRYSKATSNKYAEAIHLLKTTDCSVNGVAKRFGFQSEVFRSYLKEHEPELVSNRGMMLGENGKRVSKKSAEKYAEAIRQFKEGKGSLRGICRRLGLIYNSVGGFVRRNYPELLESNYKKE